MINLYILINLFSFAFLERPRNDRNLLLNFLSELVIFTYLIFQLEANFTHISYKIIYQVLQLIYVRLWEQ